MLINVFVFHIIVLEHSLSSFSIHKVKCSSLKLKVSFTARFANIIRKRCIVQSTLSPLAQMDVIYNIDGKVIYIMYGLFVQHVVV